jgi:uncharacterized protein
LWHFQIVTEKSGDQAPPMQPEALQLTLIAGTFVLAGGVKGIAGMGLPTVAIGLLGMLMTPAEAAAFLVIPSFVTNVWQVVAGPSCRRLLRRIWPMLLAISVATWAGAGLIAGVGANRATMFLGLALASYAILGLSKMQMVVNRRHEMWLSPLVGVATGVITGATGVFVIPAVPYLQALGLEKDDLVQALGLSFTVSTIALAFGLATYGAFRASAVGGSLLCTGPALLGMFAGQAMRAKLDPATFRVLFFVGLLLLGADLVTRALI